MTTNGPAAHPTATEHASAPCAPAPGHHSGVSSNGRTSALHADNPGSTPGAPANHRRRLFFIDKALRAFERELDRPGSRLRATLDRVPLQPHGEQRQRDMYVTRRAAVLAVMRDLLEHVDPVTLIVGRGADGEHYGRRVDRLAEANNLDQRRAERALHDIHAAGWVTSTRRAEQIAPGQWRGHTSVRQLSVELFILLGLAGLLDRTRKRLYAMRKAAGQVLAVASRRLLDRGREFVQSAERDARSLGAILGRIRPPPPKTA